MDREPEDLQFLGIVGIVGEALKILRSFAKPLGVFTLTLILPLCFPFLGFHFAFEYLLNQMKLIYQGEADRPLGERIRWEIWEWTKYYVIGSASQFFCFFFALLSTAALVYTVASIYTGKEISYARVMSVVPRVWRRLLTTFLWFYIFVGASCFVVAYLFLSTLRVKEKNSAAVIFGRIVIPTTVIFCGYVYIGIVWQLACVITVLEDKSGLGALRKSNDLIKGKRIMALVFDILYHIFVGIIGWFFGYAVLHAYRHGAGSAGRAVYATVLIVLLCFVHLMGLLIQSVFYFVCKSYHHESIHKSSLSDHLEVYLGDYVPLKSSNIQMEELHGSV